MRKDDGSAVAGTLRDAVLPALRRAILTGELAAGARLSESGIARTMRVSRSPVREAIAHLEQEGLVERFPNRGAFVADVFSKRAIAELAGLRNALECYAIQMIGTTVQPADVRPLREITIEMDAAAAARDFPLIADSDFRFHRGLVGLARHRKLTQVWAGIADQYWALYLPEVQRMERDIDHWGRNHRRILDALLSHRPDVATMYLQFNILNSAEELLEDS